MKFYLKMLRFGEGGDGGNASASGDAGATSGEGSGVDIPSSVPERARKLYAEVFSQKSASVKEQKAEASGNEGAEHSKPTYDELIKSDDYKQAHHEYMEKALNDRFKKYEGQKERLKAADGLLKTIGMKYGLDSEDKDFMTKLTDAVSKDDTYYERYADDHDMTPAEARHIVELENKVKEQEIAQKKAREEEERQAQFRVVQANSVKTQSMYPSFDLSTELQNPNFVRILSATNGDTTAAYIATHHGEIVNSVAQTVAQQAKEASAKAAASGYNRPIENGIAGTAPTNVEINFSRMSLSELRAYADEQRKKMR